MAREARRKLTLEDDRKSRTQNEEFMSYAPRVRCHIFAFTRRRPAMHLPVTAVQGVGAAGHCSVWPCGSAS